MAFNPLALGHPLIGLATVAIASTAAFYGWRYRQARLGKGADRPSPPQILALQKRHQQFGYGLIGLSIVSLIGGTVITEILEKQIPKLEDILDGTPHETAARLLVVLVIASAAVILGFRRKPWARPVHLALNGAVVLLLTLQLLSGLGIIGKVLQG
jgi:RsiW-degrading membrane proteinase PrsW (M82 family)